MKTLRYGFTGDRGEALPDEVPLEDLPRAILAEAEEMGHPDDKLLIEPEKPEETPRLDLRIQAIATNLGRTWALSLHIEPTMGGPLTKLNWREWWPDDGIARMPGESPTVERWEELTEWLTQGMTAYDAACRNIIDGGTE